MMLPILLVALTLVVSSSATLTVPDLSLVSIMDGFDNDLESELVFDTTDDLANLTFYIDHGDGQRDEGVYFTGTNFTHLYTTRGIYSGRITALSTYDGSFESAVYTARVGNVQMTECYPMVLIEDKNYQSKYSYIDGSDREKTETPSYRPDSTVVDDSISKESETIDNPCDSIARSKQSNKYSISLTFGGGTVFPGRTVSFNLFGTANITDDLTSCKLDFGDLTHSTEESVPNSDPEDLIYSWTHVYLNIGSYDVIAYCWDGAKFIESNVITTSVVDVLSTISLTSDEALIDLISPKEVRLTLSVALEGTGDLFDLSLNVDWKDGTRQDDIKIFKLTEGDNVIAPLVHNYTIPGTYNIAVDIKRPESGAAHTKTTTVVVAESLDIQMSLVKLKGIIRSEEALDLNFTNTPRFDISYTVDYGDPAVPKIDSRSSNFGANFTGFPSMEFEYEFGGNYTVTFTATNLGFRVTRTLWADVPQGVPKKGWELVKKNADKVIIDESTVKLKLKYSINRTAAPLVDVECYLDYKDGVMEDPINITYPQIVHLPWSHQFSMLGTMNVQLACENAVSSHSLNLTLEVITYTQADYKLIYDDALGIDGTLETLNTVKTKFRFSLFNIGEVFPHLVTWNYGDGSPLMSRQLYSYKHSYLYETRDVYHGNVIVWCPKGNFTYDFTIYIGVTNLTIPVTSDRKNRTFQFLLAEKRGKTFKGKIEYGDGDSDTKITCGNPCLFQHKYNRHNFYEITTEVTVGSVSERLTYADAMFVDNPVSGLHISTTQTHIKQPPGVVRLNIGMYNNSEPVNHLTCLIDLGDELDRRIRYVTGSMDTSTTLSLSAQYMSLGEQIIVANCTNRVGEQIISTTCYVESECFGGDGIFETLYADPKTPLLIMASTEVEITSRAIMLCISHPINFTWSLWTLNEQFFDRNEEIDIEQPNKDSYRILKGSMEPMLYSLELNVSTLHQDMVHWLHGLTYVRIVGSPLIVKFKGASVRATGNEHAIVNAALLSHDPDRASKTEYNMTFSWRCRYYMTQEVAELELAVLRNDPGFEIPCNNFSVEIKPGIRRMQNMSDVKRGYLYIVSATSGSKSSEVNAKSYIQFTKGAPDISIECILNCEIKRARTTAQLMEAVCPYCFKDEFYTADLRWTLVRKVSGNVYEEVTNLADITDYIEDNPAAIILKKNTLKPCQDYRLKVYVKMRHREFPGEAFSDFTVNCPPSEGTCTTTPTKGTAKSTDFQTTCTGWKDDGYGPVDQLSVMAFIYKFYISQGIYMMPLFQGAQSLTPLEPLPVIPGTKGGDYTIIARIYDALNDYAEFNTTVKLKVPVLHSLNEIGNANQAELSSGVAMDTSVLSKQLVMTTFSSSILQTVEVNSMQTFLDEYTGSGGGSGQNASWNNLFDKFMANRKDKGMKTDIAKKYKTFIEQIDAKWTNGSLKDGHGLESLGEALSTIMHRQDTVDYEVTSVGNQLVNSGATMLQDLSNQEPFPIQDKVDDVVFAMTGALDTIYNKNTPTYKTTDTVTIEAEGLSDDEKQMLKYMVLTEQAERDQETIEKGKDVIDTVENSTETLLNVMLKDQTKGQRSKTIRREGVSLTARKITARTLKDSGFDAEDFSMKFPGAHNGSMNVTDQLNLKASVTKKNLYSHASDGSSYDITSPVLTLKMEDENGTNYFDGNVTLKIQRDEPEFILYKANDTRQGEEGFFHHQFQIKKSESTFVFVDIGGRRAGKVGAYLRYDQAPVSYAEDVIYVTGEYVENYQGAKRKKRSVKTVVKFSFGPGDLRVGFVYFALDFGEMADLIKEYSLLTYSDSCRVWDRVKNVWSNDSCKISPYSTPGETLCDCVDAPGHNFASSFYVPPNLINFDLAFKKFNVENAAVYGTLLGLFFAFGIAAIWAKRKGRIDEKRWGVGYLKDNFVEDHYFYILTVHTGLTGSSGTTSRVSFILTGQKGDTGVRLLSDGQRHLETGTVMTFIMATSECLGNLKFLRIWHDNSGEGANQSWYLCKLVAEDIQTNTRSVFVCDEWLALDKSDGLIDRVIPVAFEDDLMSFSKLFSEHNRVNISDTHLWLSILLRPEKSMFTRVQRVITCLATLLLAMISSALFYQPEDAEGNSSNNPGTEVQLGSMRFSMTTLYTSTVGLLITVPPILIIVFLFKSRRPWTKKLNCCGCRRSSTLDPSESTTELELSPANSECELHRPLDKDPMNVKYENNLLPPWALILAWVLLGLIISVCSFCLVLYSMQWGKAVSEEWLASFFLSFVESIFVMDPIKVILLSTALALCMRHPQGKPDSDKLSIDVIKEQSTIHGCTEIDPTILPPDPIPEDLLERARKKKREEALANRVFVELVLYILFVFCIFCVSYGNRDTRSYNLHNHIMNQLVNPPYRKYSRVYFGAQEESFTWDRMRQVEDIYTWLNSSMHDNMFPWNSYDGNVLPWTQRLFMKDLANYRVGPVRIRQARMPRDQPSSIKSEPSLTGPLITNQENLLGHQERSPAYSIQEEEVGEHCWKWMPTPCSKTERIEALTAEAWIHRTTRQEKSFPVLGKFAVYSGAGFVFDLKFNKHVITQIILNELRSNDWLDIQTRAVFVEFTLYNVNVNLLTSVRLAAEIPEYGSVFTWYDVKPMRIYDHTGGLGALMLICQIIAVLTTIYFLVKTFKKLKEMKCQFFKEAWNLLDLLIVFLCVAAFIVYIMRKVLIIRFMGNFKRNPKSFANFYEAALCDDIYGWILAFVVFLCTLRIMRILGYNQRILMIATVLQRAAPGLFSFSLLFGVIITAFMSTGYALFHANLESFMTLWESYITILYLLMGKNVFKKMVMVSAILSRIYFFLLAILIVFIFLTIFQAILNFTITEVHSDVANAPVPYGVMNILQKFYSSLVLDNRIVEQLKRWGTTKDGAKGKANQDIHDTPPAQIEKDSSEIQKIFSVLRNHFQSTMEFQDTKKLSLDDSNTSSQLQAPHSPMRVLSPRQISIDTPSKFLPSREMSMDTQSRVLPSREMTMDTQSRVLPSRKMSIDPPSRQSTTTFIPHAHREKKKRTPKPSLLVAGDARVQPTLKKARFPLPPPQLTSKRGDKKTTSGQPIQGEQQKPTNDSSEPEAPKLTPPPRSVWASGIKTKKV